MRRITFLCVSLFFLWSATLAGQTVVTTRSTNFRRDPSTKHARIRLLGPNEQLSLLSSARRNGYYHVETSDSTKGWVLARNVRIDTTTAANPPQPDNLGLSPCRWLKLTRRMRRQSLATRLPSISTVGHERMRHSQRHHCGRDKRT